MKGESVVVTGSSGCLGYHVVKLLISHDDNVHEIRCLDIRKPSELMQKLVEEELENFKIKKGRGKRIRWIEGDVRDINVVEKTLEDCDCVIHCAAKIDVWTDSYEQDEAELESVNVGGTETLLQASVRLGVYKFIHVSSFEVYIAFDTIYFATETTITEPNWLLFGASASSKKEAENKVRRYRNNKLLQEVKVGKDSLNAIIVRCPQIYGEFDNHFVSKILECAKFLGGKITRFDNIWIRHQPIYAGNVAWSLVKAKEIMDNDYSISGEEFHITDDTAIGDPFEFLEPYLESRGMHLNKKGYPFFPIWLLLWIFFALMRTFRAMDVLGLFSEKKDRLKAAIEQDQVKAKAGDTSSCNRGKPKRWYDYVMPQTLAFICNSHFLNRTKASLRLKYEPLFDPNEASKRSLEWYKNHLNL